MLPAQNCGARSLPCGTPTIVPAETNVSAPSKTRAVFTGLMPRSLPNARSTILSWSIQFAAGRPTFVVE